MFGIASEKCVLPQEICWYVKDKSWFLKFGDRKLLGSINFVINEVLWFSARLLLKLNFMTPVMCATVCFGVCVKQVSEKWRVYISPTLQTEFQFLVLWPSSSIQK